MVVQGARDTMKVLEEGWVLKLHMAVERANLPNDQAGEGALAKAKEKPWDTKPDYSLSFTDGDLLVLRTASAHRLQAHSSQNPLWG